MGKPPGEGYRIRSDRWSWRRRSSGERAGSELRIRISSKFETIFGNVFRARIEGSAGRGGILMKESAVENHVTQSL
jgi:hypothetical protein